MRDAGKRRGFGLHEQVVMWIAGCLFVGVVLTSLPVDGTEEFRVMPNAVLTVSTAMGLVMLAYGIWSVGRALTQRAPNVGTTAFVMPFVGLAAWTAPFLAEFLLR